MTDPKGRKEEEREQKVECTSEMKYTLNSTAISLCSLSFHSVVL